MAARMLGEPSHLGTDLVLRIGEELERRQLSTLQACPFLDSTTLHHYSKQQQQ